LPRRRPPSPPRSSRRRFGWLQPPSPCPVRCLGGDGLDRYARWGEQLDVRNITTGDDQAGELGAEQVAGYIAKYATKATESFGSGLDRRLGAAWELAYKGFVADLAKVARALGA